MTETKQELADRCPPDVRVIEECSELIKEICKVQRFGWESYHPDDKPDMSNAQRVLMEIHDVEVACKNLRIMIMNLAIDKIKELIPELRA